MYSFENLFCLVVINGYVILIISIRLSVHFADIDDLDTFYYIMNL